MRSRIALAAVAALAASAFTPTGVPVLRGEVGPGYFATSNVEWLGNIPVNADSAGARVLDDLLYITDDRGLVIYDISDPTLPLPLGNVLVPQMAYLVEEDVDTNGEILLIGGYGLRNGSAAGALGTLHVVDVSDPSAPAVLSTLSGHDEHTWSCVLDCTYAYGSAGDIVDLRDPANPQSVGNWTQHAPVSGSHDVTEVAPGLVVTSSNPVVYLDLRDDPVRPSVLATGELPDGRFIHGNIWAQGGTDDKLLVGGETMGSCATQDAGQFMTFDASSVVADDAAWAAADAAGEPRPERTGSFVMLDEHYVDTGLYTDGDSPYDQFCAHWFTTAPDFDGAGLVSMGWYEHGVRFLDVAHDGTITEVGYWVPLGGSTSAAYWVEGDIIITADYQRGIDILRFDRDAEAVTEVAVGDGAAAVAAGDARAEDFAWWAGLQARLDTRLAAGSDASDTYLCPRPGLG